jgi:tetratricopeptide (TPR) repeat protein
MWMDETKYSIQNDQDVPVQIIGDHPTIRIGAGTSYQSSVERAWNVPYLRNPFFTGREHLLEDLHHYLSQAGTAALTQPSAITGMGGIGKTQIAIEYAYRHRDDYNYVLWVNVANQETALEGFAAIARLLHLPEEHEQDLLKVREAVLHWLNQHDSWLLILDNADDLNLASDFVPTGGRGHILLTTREHAVRALALPIEVTGMNVDEGTLMLLRRANILSNDTSLDQITLEERETARTIVQEMDGLPLALDQAGAYIEEKKSTLKKYLEIYLKRGAHSLKERGRHSKDYRMSVATTWLLNFEQVEQNNPAAADLLRCCAFLAPDDIPDELFMQSAAELGPRLRHIADTPGVLEEARGDLLRFSLVRYNPDTEALSIHRLVQFILTTMMDKKTQRQWAERVVRAVDHLFPDPQDVTQWLQCQRYLSHALACFGLVKQYNLTLFQASHLLAEAANYLADQALFEQVESMYQQALTIVEQQSPNSSDTASVLYNLAKLYYDQGKYEQAEPLLERAFTIDEQSLEPNDPNLASSLNFLAELYRTQGRYEEAEPLYQRAQTIVEQAFGPDHPDVARGLNNLAGLYYAQGRYEEVEPLLKRVWRL